MRIDAVAILNRSGQQLALQTFSRRTVDESWVTLFVAKIKELADLPSVLEISPGVVVLSMCREGLFMAAVATTEIPPLLVLETLDKLFSVLRSYLAGDLTEDAIRANQTTVHLLLLEALDAGMVGILEPGVLEGIVQPPKPVNRVLSAVTGAASKILPDTELKQSINRGVTTALSALSSAIAGPQTVTPDQLFASPEVWWRRNGLSYPSNEIYVDLQERVDAIFSGAGKVVMCAVVGNLTMHAKLTGDTPEVLMSVKEGGKNFNWGVHPCVKKQRWIRARTISFIPPDGQFVLGHYVYTPTEAPIPLTVNCKAVFDREGGKVELQVSPKLALLLGGKGQGERTVEDIRLSLKLPSCVGSATLTTRTGSAKFSPDDKCIVWNINKLSTKDSAASRMEGTVKYAASLDPDAASRQANEFGCYVELGFLVKAFTPSGVRIDSLDVTNVNYTPYKGCRYSTHGGRIEYRI